MNKKEFKFAFIQSVPVLLGYLFLGFAFGVLIQNAGYSPLWAFFSSVFVYAGSGQFLMVTFLTGATGLISVFIMTFLLNSRHIFYGLTFVEKFRSFGKAFPYMVFSLTDETYSLLCSLKVPEEMSEKRVMVTIAILNHCYWIGGSTLGALVGSALVFNATGIDFAMTALFVVIFVEQWQGTKCHIPAIIGGISATAFLIVLGPSNFLLPSLVVTVGVLCLMKNTINSRTALDNTVETQKEGGSGDANIC